MNKKNAFLLIAGALSMLPFASTAQAKVFAEWDFTLPSSFNKGLDEIQATGETGAGNTFYAFANARGVDNFTGSKVYDINKGYSLRKNIATEEIVRVDTGMTAADRTGQAYMIINFTSWNLPGAHQVTTNFDAGARAGIRLRTAADGVYLGAWLGTWQESATPVFGLSAENISIAMQYDYVDGINSARVFYSTNGGTSWIDSGLFLDGRATGQIDYIKWGTVGQLGQIGDELYEFNVRSIIVSNQIPEPSTYALIGGAAALLVVGIARRRSRKS